MERIYLGEKDVTDLDWVKKVVESEISKTVLKRVQKMASEAALEDKLDKEKIGQLVTKMISKKND